MTCWVLLVEMRVVVGEVGEVGEECQGLLL